MDIAKMDISRSNPRMSGSFSAKPQVANLDRAVLCIPENHQLASFVCK